MRLLTFNSFLKTPENHYLFWDNIFIRIFAAYNYLYIHL